MNSTTDPEYHSDASRLYFIGATISIFFCVLIIVLYAMFPKHRRHPSPIVLYRSLCDVAFCVAHIISYGLDEPEGGSSACKALSMVNQAAAFASNAWYLMLSVDLFLAIRNPFSSHNEYTPFYHIAVWGMSAATALILAVANRWGLSMFLFCWIRVENKDDLNLYSWFLFYAPIMAITIISGAVWILAKVSLTNDNTDSDAIRQRVLKQGVAYVAAFSVYWAFTGAVWIAQFVHVRDSESDLAYTSFPLIVVFSITIGFRGFLDAVMWIRNNKVTPRLFWDRLCEICAHARLRLSSSRNVQTSASLVQPLLATASNTPLSSAGGEVDEPINKILRRDVMRLISYGIYLRAIKPDDDESRTSSRTSRGLSFASTGTSAHDVHSNVGMSIAMTSMMSPRTDEVVREQLPRPFGSGTYEFVDYAPGVFAGIRHIRGITPEDYRRSFVMEENQEAQMLEKFTDGRSGSFFYFCHDMRYIVKTVNETEKNLLLHILPEYHDYMIRNQNTLLAPIVGLHSVRKSWENKLITFIVMSNTFLTDLPERDETNTKVYLEKYDLKGSWIDRATFKAPQVDDLGRTDKTLKDADLERRHVRVKIGHSAREIISQQILSDATFLESVNIMDYSMLVGIRHRPVKQDDANYASLSITVNSHVPLHRRCHGGLPSEDGESLYFLGIIDMLQGYDINKKFEHFAKANVLRKDKRGISAVEPQWYRERFVEAMRKLIV